jgi:lipopolysaccharide O-acetyltransferase
MRIYFYLLSLIKRIKLSSKNISVGKGMVYGRSFRCEVIERYLGVTYSPKIVFGHNIHIEDFVHIGCVNRVEIGDNTLIASKVYISDHNHGYYDDEHTGDHENPKETAPILRKLTSDSYVRIGSNVWIGQNVTILPGSIIGDGAIIGANSVVRGVIKEYTISVGSPARSIKKYNFETASWSSINVN